MSVTIEKQNQIIISLLARTAFGEEHIDKLVRSGKKKGNTDAYVMAYNALDGTKSATQIANMLGVSKQSVSQMFQAWEDKGIVYRVGNEKSPYFALLKLTAKTRRSIKAAKKRTDGGKVGLKSEVPSTETIPDSLQP